MAQKSTHSRNCCTKFEQSAVFLFLVFFCFLSFFFVFFGDLIVVNVSPNQNTDLEVSCPPTQQRYVTLIAGGTANLTGGFAQSIED